MSLGIDALYLLLGEEVLLVYLLVFRRLKFNIKRLRTAFLEKDDARFRLLRRKTIVLVADKSPETEALDIAKAIAALLIDTGKLPALAILLLIVANDRQKILVDENLFLRLRLAEASILPNENELIERRAFEEFARLVPVTVFRARTCRKARTPSRFTNRMSSSQPSH